MPKVPAIVRTRSLRGGHYRAGLRHGAEPGDIPPGTVTEEHLARLQADPDLEVEVIDPPQGPPQDAPPPRKKKPGAAGDPTLDKADDAGDGAGGGEDFGFDEDPEPAPEAKGK
ncbi:hypothetical protein DSECCO2_597860 [anaerobic digester metagenome]